MKISKSRVLYIYYVLFRAFGISLCYADWKSIGEQKILLMRLILFAKEQRKRETDKEKRNQKLKRYRGKG